MRHTPILSESAYRIRDFLREINVELVTVHQRVDGIFKELPAIRDTAGKATMILSELSITSAKISTLHDELPLISGKITTIHDDMPVLAEKVTVIHDELPALRDAVERLAVSSVGGMFDRIQTNNVTAESTSSSRTHPCTIWAGLLCHAI